ncbi:PHB depolymerase family esterase [Streptomyces sp. A3M-1-3]|uniref:extracellular catalytic domain type 1 short-chain-length polyhydroxyalkanoate depolymerase n=1 Tax=Streptomyces sp. A3M-1-3 TaxID=2962044 RepID=UPI0020B64311|nr:PHB depolymerase family esterase [Streptomyces sp. A3M-1-3]MCP3822354.1 PHB depolymerase family esterase [Streptomyces sp. A3M-1-3]
MRTTVRRWGATVAGALLAVTTAGLSTAPGAQAASLTEVTSFGSNPGNLKMFRYVPDGLPAGRPLVVAMHGCTQSAAAFDAETGWTKWADQWGFALLLPQQQSLNNSSSCFNWFETGDTARGSGEALSIKQMVDRMKTDVGSSASQVYATGLSAGGAMTTTMLAAYPDVFAGGAVVAGLPYRCATTVAAAYSCMSPGTNLTAAQWGDKVRAANPGYTGPWPKVSIWQGSSDTTVVPMNMTEVAEQWTNTHGADMTADVSDTVGGYPHKVYNNASGTPVVETFSITGMQHGQPVDPGAGAQQCGTAGAYILDVNLCASYEIGKFWGITDSGGGEETSATLPSVGAQDGYVKADASGGGAVVGTLESTSGLALGRGTDGLHNRSVLSFDTSTVPDGATIIRAYVTVAYASASGNPWASPAGNRLVADVRNGCFGAACTTAADDWAAAATASDVAAIDRFTSGTKASSDFSAAGLSAVSRTGTTQVRLRFEQNPTATNYVFIKPAAEATLHVEWTP